MMEMDAWNNYCWQNFLDPTEHNSLHSMSLKAMKQSFEDLLGFETTSGGKLS